MVRSTEKPGGGKTPRPEGLKMQDLVAATGVPRSTILHYLNEGLLPEPVKTSRNMAYYSPTCVERINCIKVMQGKYRLSLTLIKKFLEEGKLGPELEPLLELRSFIFGRPEDRELLDLEAYCRATGLTVPEVEALRQAELLLPLEPDRFDAEPGHRPHSQALSGAGPQPWRSFILPPSGPGDRGPRNGHARPDGKGTLPGSQCHPDAGADPRRPGPAALHH